jgi:hypothetical protein
MGRYAVDLGLRSGARCACFLCLSSFRPAGPNPAPLPGAPHQTVGPKRTRQSQPNKRNMPTKIGFYTTAYQCTSRCAHTVGAETKRTSVMSCAGSQKPGGQSTGNKDILARAWVPLCACADPSWKKMFVRQMRHASRAARFSRNVDFIHSKCDVHKNIQQGLLCGKLDTCQGN